MIYLYNFGEWPDADNHTHEETIKAKLLEIKRCISPNKQFEKRRDHYEHWYEAVGPSDYVPSFSSVNYSWSD